MNSSKPKVKLGSKRSTPLQRKEAKLAQFKAQKQRKTAQGALLAAKSSGNFADIVSAIAARYGVTVAPLPAPRENPYAMSAEQAADVAMRAGITTRTGNLKSPFK